MTQRSPFRYFRTSPEVIRLAVMLTIRFPLSLRNLEDLLHERGIQVSQETVRFWWMRFGLVFAAKIRCKRVTSISCDPAAVAPWGRVAVAGSAPHRGNDRGHLPLRSPMKGKPS